MKFDRSPNHLMRDHVTLFTGVWIEISGSQSVQGPSVVTLFTGVWIEIKHSSYSLHA